MAILTLGFSMGTVTGPALGGLLAEPCSVFGDGFPLCRPGQLFAVRCARAPLLCVSMWLCFAVSRTCAQLLGCDQSCVLAPDCHAAVYASTPEFVAEKGLVPLPELAWASRLLGCWMHELDSHSSCSAFNVLSFGTCTSGQAVHMCDAKQDCVEQHQPLGCTCCHG